jgi:acyl dehydratase
MISPPSSSPGRIHVPIDPAKAIGHKISGGRYDYTEMDIVLYHLGLGAGNPATDPGELEYTYEECLKVLPTFGVIAALNNMSGLLDAPGLKFDPEKLLHGAHAIEIRKPFTTNGKLDSVAQIANIWDKGRAAVVDVDITTTDADGEVVCVNTLTMFLRDEGGFGGDAGPPQRRGVDTSRLPDRRTRIDTFESQALLYRLSGDWMPLHADPEVARRAGFERPILHGLCSYGMVCRAVVDGMLDGDVGRVRTFEARFADVVYPGDELEASMWRDDDTIAVSVRNITRSTAVLTHAAVTVADT